jgi:hypothetical protein
LIALNPEEDFSGRDQRQAFEFSDRASPCEEERGDMLFVPE